MDDNESSKPLEHTDTEQELDGWNPWNVPRAVAVPTPRLDEWPERELRFEDGLARMEGPPAG